MRCHFQPRRPYNRIDLGTHRPFSALDEARSPDSHIQRDPFATEID